MKKFFIFICLISLIIVIAGCSSAGISNKDHISKANESSVNVVSNFKNLSLADSGIQTVVLYVCESFDQQEQDKSVCEEPVNMQSTNGDFSANINLQNGSYDFVILAYRSTPAEGTDGAFDFAGLVKDISIPTSQSIIVDVFEKTEMQNMAELPPMILHGYIGPTNLSCYYDGNYSFLTADDPFIINVLAIDPNGGTPTYQLKFHTGVSPLSAMIENQTGIFEIQGIGANIDWEFELIITDEAGSKIVISEINGAPIRFTFTCESYVSALEMGIISEAPSITELGFTGYSPFYPQSTVQMTLKINDNESIGTFRCSDYLNEPSSLSFESTKPDGSACGTLSITPELNKDCTLTLVTPNEETICNVHVKVCDVRAPAPLESCDEEYLPIAVGYGLSNSVSNELNTLLMHLNGNLADQSGNNYDGQVLGNLTSKLDCNVAGQIGDACYFDNSNNAANVYVSAGENDNLDLGNNIGDSLFVSYWIKTPPAGHINPKWSLGKGDGFWNVGYGVAHYASKTDSDGNIIWPYDDTTLPAGLYINDGTTKTTVDPATGQSTTTYPHRYSLRIGELEWDSWEHIAWALERIATDKIKMTTYFNGIYQTEKTVTIGSINTSEAFTIGKMGSSYFTGTLDDVVVFKRALSKDEVFKIYFNGFYHKTLF